MMLSVICDVDSIEAVQQVIFAQTSTIGIRLFETKRVCMERNIIEINTPFGAVRMKEAVLGDIKKFSPEYEDCKKIADEQNIPIQDVYRIIVKLMPLS